MADQQAILDRQTKKLEELRELAQAEPSIASLQALASILRDRGATLAAMGRHEEAAEDRRTANGLLTQLVLGAGRDDLLDVLVESGEQLRESLQALGRDEEALDLELAEAQVLAGTGQAARGVAILRRIAEEQKKAVEAGGGIEALDRLVKVHSLLGGTLLSLRRADEALEVEDAAVDAVAAFQPPQPEYVATLRANRAMAKAATGKIDEALQELEEVAQTFDSFGEASLGQSLDTRLRRAQLLSQVGRVEEGLAATEEAVAFAEKHASLDDDAAALHRQALRVLIDAARMASKDEVAVKALDRWEEELAKGPKDDPALALERLEATQERALTLLVAKRHQEALDAANQLVSAWSKMAESQTPSPETAQRLLAAVEMRERALVELGRHEEAVADQSALLQTYQSLLQQGGPPELMQGLLMTLQRRSESLRKLGRLVEADADASTLRSLLQRLRGGGDGGPQGGPQGPQGGPPPGGSGIII